jgi:transposase
MTADLLALGDWLVAAGCTHVAMESTGVYWKPVYNLLEGRVPYVWVVNARHVKAVPGRKTDQNDAMWLAQLLQHGLLKPSFVPPAPIRALREVTRYRSQCVAARADEANRIQKLLEAANLKLAAVATDVLGVSGRAMLAALVKGETDAALLAALAKGRLRRKQALLVAALTGRVTPPQRALLGAQLAHIEFLDRAIGDLDAQIATLVAPHARALARLDTIPGVDRRTAEVLLAELSPDMAVFPSAEACAAWAGACPGSNETGGQRRAGKRRKGSPWLHRALVQAAWAASHTKTYLGAQYHRFARRLGVPKKAVGAVAHTLLVIAYHILKRETTYRELGHDYFHRQNTAQQQQRLIRRLEGLGLRVTVEPMPAAA